MVDTPSYQNKSKIIEERLEWAKQRAKESLDMHAYSIILEGLYEMAKKKAPEALPTLEKLVERTNAFTFDIQLLSAIRDYIRDYIPATEQDNTYKQRIENLKEGLEKLLDWDVRHYLFELYHDIRSGELIPLDYDFYLRRVSNWAYFTGHRLDWETQRMYAQEEAAYDYLRNYVECLLSNPDGYIQHTKAGDLGAFVRESCKSYLKSE
jgi:hypothetical protein